MGDLYGKKGGVSPVLPEYGKMKRRKESTGDESVFMRGRRNRPRLVLARNGIKAKVQRSAIAHHHLRLSDNMGLRDGLRDFLSLPRKDRRTRSEARSEVDPTAGSAEVDLVAPRPTESSPDLRIGSSTLPSPSPLASRNQESNSTSTALFRVISLTTSPRKIGRPAVLGQIRSVFKSGQSKNPKPSDHKTTDPSAAHEDESNWKSTAYSTTKLAINLVKESSDAFPPLKSVVGGLSAILQHCDV
jgi:hypothetical protein